MPQVIDATVTYFSVIRNKTHSLENQAQFLENGIYVSQYDGMMDDFRFFPDDPENHKSCFGFMSL